MCGSIGHSDISIDLYLKGSEGEREEKVNSSHTNQPRAFKPNDPGNQMTRAKAVSLQLPLFCRYRKGSSLGAYLDADQEMMKSVQESKAYLSSQINALEEKLRKEQKDMKDLNGHYD